MSYLARAPLQRGSTVKRVRPDGDVPNPALQSPVQRRPHELPGEARRMSYLP
jgi:hypothetical protein